MNKILNQAGITQTEPVARFTKDQLVTVVMVTYIGDNPAFLQEAVASILCQTHGNLEFIIVLNGPVRAEAEELLLNTALRDNRVVLIRLEKNFGVSHARNQGILKARGEFIAIMDADDIAVPERIMRQHAHLAETGADLAGSFYYMIDDQGNAIGRKEVPVSSKDIKRWLYLFCPLSNPTVFSKAAILKSNLYDIRFNCSEDYNLWIRLLKKGYVIRNQPEYLLLFRKNANFIVKRRGWNFFVSDLKNKLALQSLYPYYQRPIILLVTMITVLSRLLPISLLEFIYSIRNKLTFQASQPARSTTSPPSSGHSCNT